MGKEFKLKPMKENIVQILIVGDTDLVLCKKARSYELRDVWKQNHEEGEEVPDELLKKNEWENFITSITWEKPIHYHDDNFDLYTKDEWNYYMENNRPCILSYAFKKSFKDAFISMGFKKSTKKNGSDIDRVLNFQRKENPINFAKVVPESCLVPNKKNKTNVVCNQNVFSGWSCELSFCVPDGSIPTNTLINVVQTAGRYIGIGSRRLEGFGRYHIDKATDINMRWQ